MLSRLANLRLALLLPALTLAADTETTRVGGSGGNHTVTMDCGAGSFIVGVSANGGRDGTFGFNLVRRVSFSCRAFNGSTPGTATSTTTAAVADHPATTNFSNGDASCPSGYVATNLELFAGTFIDRVHTMECTNPTQGQTNPNVNVGGDGGSRQFLQCPAGQALFKIVAKTGDAIDSLKGFCRTFTPTASLNIASQISSSVSPDPSPARPLAVPPGATKTFKFTIAGPSSTQLVAVGITAETDLLGGGAANPPEYRLDLVNPSGRVVVTKTFNKPSTLVIQSVSTHFDVAGVWSLKVVNLKQQIGGLSVLAFSAFLPQ